MPVVLKVEATECTDVLTRLVAICGEVVIGGDVSIDVRSVEAMIGTDVVTMPVVIRGEVVIDVPSVEATNGTDVSLSATV
jgi:hypothetical protein